MMEKEQTLREPAPSISNNLNKLAVRLPENFDGFPIHILRPSAYFSLIYFTRTFTTFEP